jgi:hypothetical protein
MYEITNIIHYIKEHKLDTSNRRQDVLFKRYYLMKYLRYVEGMTLEKIGSYFNRDHATVCWGLKQFDFYSQFKDFQESTRELYIYFPITSKKQKDTEQTFSISIPQSLITLQMQYNKRNG